MNLADYRLGETNAQLELQSAADTHAAALELFRQARREILIMSHDLEPLVLSHEDIVEALSGFLRQGRHAHAHILVQNSNKAVKHGHRLVPLAHRLSSSIKFNRPGYEHRDFNEAFMVVDGIGFIKRQLADRFEGVASFKSPIEGRDLRALFLSMWERSEPDPQLRRLQI